MSGDPPPLRVLFCCLGNICRSPAAEEVFRRGVELRGLASRVAVDSAGILDYHEGRRPDLRMRRAAERRGYVLESRARPVTGRDFEEFDLIVAMDRDNVSDLARIAEARPGQVRRLGEYLASATGRDIPDPYEGGPAGFELVLDLLEDACPRLLDTLVKSD